MATVERATWSNKLAFVLAGAASAVGLGSMWRFPYLAAKYGGGTFLFLYLVFVFTIGIALLLLETAFGRKTGQSCIGAFKSFGKKYAPVGVFASCVPFIIVPYYCVIGGWTVKYMTAYLSAGPATLADGGGYFNSFISSGWESALFMLVFMVATYAIVALGVNNGIEKANLVMMPALIVVSLALGIYALTLPGALDGLAFYLIPDLSKFSPELIIAALGQTFFTLSLAMGIMFTYGSYLEKKEKLTSSVVQIAGTTFAVSLLAGLMVVPATFAALGSGDAVAQNAGPSLMFVILPQVFNNMGAAGGIIGFVFFILVIFAALTSSVSLTEACVSIIHDGTGCTRKRAIVISVIFITVVGFVVNLGYSNLAFIQPLGEGTSILDFMDFLSNSVMMPLAALMTCIFVGWIIGPKVIADEVKESAAFKLEKVWTATIKYIAPVCIVLILVAYVAQTFGLITL